MGADRSWWISQTSNLMWGGYAGPGGFDSHTLLPKKRREDDFVTEKEKRRLTELSSKSG